MIFVPKAVAGPTFGVPLAGEIRELNESGKYVGSPSILRLSDGTLIASSDEFGANSYAVIKTHIDVSTNDGASWSPLVSPLTNMFWGRLFQIPGDPLETFYILGTSGENANIVIGKTTDKGQNWALSTLFSGRFHTAPCTVLFKGGKIYAAYEEVGDLPDYRPRKVFVLSSLTSSDLTASGSWTMSNKVDWALLLGGTESLESNILEAPDGSVVVLSRALFGGMSYGHYTYNTSTDTLTAAGNRSAAFGFCKFHIVRDSETGIYLCAGNEYHAGGDDRTWPRLWASEDLISWTPIWTFLDFGAANMSSEGCHYPSLFLSGRTLYSVWRVGYDGAASAHNSNRLWFHRIGDIDKLLNGLF